MLFNSYEFIFVFLPLVFGGFFVCGTFSRRLAALWLAVASLAFYGWWNPRFVGLIMASIAFNYVMARAIAGRRGRNGGRALLIVGIAANLGLLGVYKYTDFVLGASNAFLGTAVPMFEIVLPLGISFFTFTQIAFLVDVHRALAEEYDPVHYVLFVTYFPHLIAGPLLHHKEMMPQFNRMETYRVHAENVAIGLTVFTVGLAKKVLLADNFARFAEPVFNVAHNGAELRLAAAWTGALAYTLQLYFDFSGYSDMAIGMSRMFGIQLPQNFFSPYKAWNIIEFWRRWHMTLSRFLRDYLYFPLGGNRSGVLRRYSNLMITMLLGGLWHGANWTFVIWGGFHGFLLVLNHAWHGLKPRFGVLPKLPFGMGRKLSVLATFLAVVAGWVVFRSPDLGTARSIFGAMVGLHGISLPERLASFFGGVGVHSGGIVFDGLFDEVPAIRLLGGQFVCLAVIGLVIVWGCPNVPQWLGESADTDVKNGKRRWFPFMQWSPTSFAAAAVGMLLALSLMQLSKVAEFLYFQF
jgi:alginate O-acetyltransferase complex protein AlgI